MQYHPVLLPAECHDMSDIRREIDHIDYTVIQLLSARFNYVKTASKFKKNATDVQATERFNSMLEKRKQWADEMGLNGEVIKALYADLVNYFIAEELKEFESK
ncbi:chorismate mutase [Snodgrassella alvi]|uniref:chorismate mutase n=1 Tax=Snodgrassella alvi TaxID=1196083 RepID=A0A855FYM2_9NEIS|nr:chorismate mutase [Snodgrassella alvi]PIT58880.1 isochorismate-pyruvate lyase [Snodgrassella alvi]